MNRESFELARVYFERELERPIQYARPLPVSGMHVVQILWPLNELFRARLDELTALPYSPAHEQAVDAAILDYSKSKSLNTLALLPKLEMRVLYERHTQILATALANEKAGNPVTMLPEGLPESAQLPGIALVLLYKMELPWPPAGPSAP